MADPNAIQVSIRHRAGPLNLHVDFVLHSSWTVLFAPSGAGKTTILRMIAGLQKPDQGRITLNNDRTNFLALDSSQGICVPPHRRHVSLVAQRPALFPHLSVLENVNYGMRWQQLQDDKMQQGKDVERIMNLCRIPLPLRDARPGQLSGGERQRVALARSIAVGTGRLLMLDEPFTGLEASLRDDIIADLRAWTKERGLPVLLVTHDLGEVFAADAHVLKMESGRIVASGPAHEVLAEERVRLLARLKAQS